MAHQTEQQERIEGLVAIVLIVALCFIFCAVYVKACGIEHATVAPTVTV